MIKNIFAAKTDSMAYLLDKEINLFTNPGVPEFIFFKIAESDLLLEVVPLEFAQELNAYYLDLIE